MRLIFLGTSAAQPTADRGLSCICLETEGEVLMFDAGEAAQMSFQKSGLGWNKRMRIFVTHLHGDHVIGILGLLQTMSMQERTEPLYIYGPEGTEEFVAANIKVLKFGLSFPVFISTVTGGLVLDSKKYSIHACGANHSVPAFSYMFREKDRPGRFDVERAAALGVPEGRLWGMLQHGSDVTVNGRKVTPDQVLGETRPGKRIGVSGDTAPSSALERFFEGCDYLVFDSTFLEESKDRAELTGHSTARQAAVLGKNANVGNLILTHFSARYKNDREHLEEARLAHDSVIAAADMLEVKIR